MPGVIRFARRDIVRVMIDDIVQAFYRSSGRNSNMPGAWLPFDGVTYYLWFDKSRFAQPPELERFGTELNQQISLALSKIDIPEGEEFDYPVDVNLWIGSIQSKTHLGFFVNHKLIPDNWSMSSRLDLPIYKLRNQTSQAIELDCDKVY